MEKTGDATNDIKKNVHNGMAETFPIEKKNLTYK